MHHLNKFDLIENVVANLIDLINKFQYFSIRTNLFSRITRQWVCYVSSQTRKKKRIPR